MRIVRRIGLSSVLAIALATGPGPARAASVLEQAGRAGQAPCSCLISDEEDQLREADVVFKGTYEGSTSSAYRERDGETHTSGTVRHFTAFESYKGVVKPDIAVLDLAATEAAGDCGHAIGGMGGERTYLVYAEHPNGAAKKKYDLAESDLVLKPCGGTREIDADDQPGFGPGRPVTAAAQEPESAPPAEPADPAAGEGEYGLAVLGDLVARLLDLGTPGGPAETPPAGAPVS